MSISAHAHAIIEGILEVKLSTDGLMQLQGREQAEKRKRQKRKSQEKEDCKKVEKLRSTMFFQHFVAVEGSLKRRVRSHVTG